MTTDAFVDAGRENLYKLLMGVYIILVNTERSLEIS